MEQTLLFLCLLPTVFGGYLETLAASASGGAEASRFEGMVAFHCGLPALHRSASGAWVRDLYQDCVNTDEEVKRYCQRVYPATEIINVERAPSQLRVSGWCGFGKESCPETPVVTVRPVRCLDAAFQSDALLVPTGCTFGHMVPGMSSKVAERGQCKSQDAWNVTATAECARRFPGFSLRRFGGLVPCTKDDKHLVGFFKGVEFVCCPKEQTPHLPQLVKVSKQLFDPNAVQAKPQSADKKGERAYPPGRPNVVAAGRDTYVDYLNRAQDPEESEHDRYMDAKDALRKKMRQREDSIVKSFIQAEHSLDDMWKVDKEGAVSLEDRIIGRFRMVFGAVLDEEMAQLRQMDHIHQRRVLQKLHDKSERARKMLEYASQEVDPQLKRITEAAFEYLRAVMKEKVHAINHYSHLLDTDPKEAAGQLSQLRSYLHRLHKEMKAEMTRLTKQAPNLSNKLKERILQFMRTYSEVEASARSLEETGKMTAETRTGQSRKELELEHMESVISAYKHGNGAGPKAATVLTTKKDKRIKEKSKKEKDDEKVVHVLPVPGEEQEDMEALADKEVVEVKKFVHHPGMGGHYAKAAHHMRSEDDNGRDHHANDGHRHGEDGHPNTRVVRSSFVTWTVIGCVAVAALVAAASALLVLRRRYAGYAQAPASGAAATAVEALPANAGAPSAADLAAMQTNGYENPTYKYFELRGKAEESEA